MPPTKMYILSTIELCKFTELQLRMKCVQDTQQLQLAK